MDISGKDQSDIQWFLGIGGTKFVRSVSGVMLQRADEYAHDSTGKLIPSVKDPWDFMKLHPTRGEGGYLPELDDMHRFASTDILLRRIGRESPLAKDVLEAYLGERGAKWGREKVGRIASVWRFTKTGSNRLGHLWLNGKRRIGGQKEEKDWLLVNDYHRAMDSADSVMLARYERMTKEAKVLLDNAGDVIFKVKLSGVAA